MISHQGQMHEDGKKDSGEGAVPEPLQTLLEGEPEEDRHAAELVGRFQAGDMEAFGELYSLYFDRVYGYARIAFEDVHEAEDAAQQVFAQALESLHGYELRPGKPFRAWLFVVVRNYVISQLERRARVEVMDPTELNRRRERSGAYEEDKERALGWITDSDLLIFVDLLSLDQRRVLTLRFLFDLSLKQTATVLGRTPGEVASLQHRAVVFLRDRLAAIGRAPERPDPSARSKVWVKPAQVIRARRSALD